nr:MAG TPA: hypothetical protein [Caudoviricetes sp.]
MTRQPAFKSAAGSGEIFFHFSFFLFFFDFPHARPTQHHAYRSGRSAADLRAGNK